MALLVVRLLGWALHVETGRDQADELETEDDTEDEPTVVGGDLLDAGHPDTAMGFVLPSTECE